MTSAGGKRAEAPPLDGSDVKLSVVIRSKDEADRLRLCLASLARQSMAAEVVVVDDGSSDHTGEVIAEAAGRLPLAAIRHPTALGRSAASNAGARAASGDILLFLDGDNLAGPECVEGHALAHARRPGLAGRGETLHLRSTRFLLDPETASPRPGEEARLAAMPAAERERLKVTRRQIEEDFDAIHSRASPGIYPGLGPRALYDLEIAALRDHPDCSVLWAAASGSNFSVRRSAFLAVGGFDEQIDINEHRELALRLCQAGERMGLVEGARTYHLTHRTGWRDPLEDTGWAQRFYRRHPIPAVNLLPVMWASVAAGGRAPREGRILSLPELEQAARGERDVDCDAVRRLLPGWMALHAGSVRARTE